MEGGSDNDLTKDSFVSGDDIVDLDLPVTSPLAKIPKFRPNIKGKAKLTSPFNVPKIEDVAITGTTPSTVFSGVGPASDVIEQVGGDSMDVDDEDDVIREISVFCGSGNLGDDTQLYVIQHVLREAWRPYELNKRCEEVRLKPKQLKIEFDLRMETDNENYDQEVSQPLKLQKLRLSSSVVASGIQYAVGFLETSKLHLNPIHAILQLRPSLACLHDLTKTEFVPKTTEASTKAMKEKVTLKNSYESKVDDEPWVLLQYHPTDSPISNKNKHKMATEVARNVQFCMRPSDYLHFLPSANLANETTSRTCGTPSMRLLLQMPLDKRLKKWFCERNQVNRFDVLKHLAYGHSEDDLFKMLRSHANLVQGLWVCKSSLLYSGAEAIQRDYILLLFNRMNTIQYHKLREINLNPIVFKNMMSALACDRKLLGDWKFKQPTDFTFIKHYPNIVREQENAWLCQEKIILDSIRNVGKKVPLMARASQASDFAKTTIAHNTNTLFTDRDRNAIESLTAGHVMSSETHEHLARALLEIFNDKKVRSLQSIVRGLREMALYKSARPKEDPKTILLVNAAANAVSAPVKELCSVIDQVALYIHGIYVLKSAGNPALDPLRNVVINLFKGKEPNAKLKKQEIIQDAQLSLKREISDTEFNQVINELCISSKGAWELKSGE